ncbi:MAG: hypothetical protein LBQ20_05630 [Rhodanobacter sp.]|jgi:hypothetical protein|nr:hypothetical protein [Rhodanobacter sp.]
MVDPSITSADVRGRALAGDLSRTDPPEALKVARAIRHPWYRCQALSDVAESWGAHTQKLQVLEEALAVAGEQSEINRIVSASAWPLRVMVGVAPNDVAAHLRRLVALAEQEPHTLRRADALSLLAFAVRQEPFFLALVSPSLANALLNGWGWRIDRLIRDAVEMLSDSMPDVIEKLVEHHGEGREKRAFLKSLGRAG